MGTFTVPIQVGNLAGEEFIEITALVGTGSTYTTLPAGILTRLGVTPEGHRRFELADNRIVEYAIGHARLRLNGEETVNPVVFAQDDSAPLLGAVTLEIFSLVADQVHRRLAPVVALLK